MAWQDDRSGVTRTHAVATYLPRNGSGEVTDDFRFAGDTQVINLWDEIKVYAGATDAGMELYRSAQGLNKCSIEDSGFIMTNDDPVTATMARVPMNTLVNGTGADAYHTHT